MELIATTLLQGFYKKILQKFPNFPNAFLTINILISTNLLKISISFNTFLKISIIVIIDIKLIVITLVTVHHIILIIITKNTKLSDVYRFSCQNMN